MSTFVTMITETLIPQSDQIQSLSISYFYNKVSNELRIGESKEEDPLTAQKLRASFKRRA